AKNQQPVYLGFWRPIALKPAPLLGVGRKCALELSNSGLAMASWYGLPWLAYEGGSDTFGDGSIPAKASANMDPRMEDICKRYLNTWYSQGGGLFMWFNAGAGNWNTPYGAWELTPDLAITDTPKIRCVDSVLGNPLPAPQARNMAPGVFSALAFAGNHEPYSAASRTTVRHLGVGSSLFYLVLARQAGQYQLAGPSHSKVITDESPAFSYGYRHPRPPACA
ncbi:hypothetical protein MXC99_00645, partial [Thauera aromatica]|nr:hypothetical protein [Thauera aromatica]